MLLIRSVSKYRNRGASHPAHAGIPAMCTLWQFPGLSHFVLFFCLVCVGFFF